MPHQLEASDRPNKRHFFACLLNQNLWVCYELNALDGLSMPAIQRVPIATKQAIDRSFVVGVEFTFVAFDPRTVTPLDHRGRESGGIGRAGRLSWREGVRPDDLARVLIPAYRLIVRAVTPLSWAARERVSPRRIDLRAFKTRSRAASLRRRNVLDARLIGAAVCLRFF